jgi:integrase
VWSPRDRRPLRKTFPTVADAVAWRKETQVEIRRGRAGAPSAQTLAEAAHEWLALAQQGVVRTRSGDRYKPSALRAYELDLRSKLLPELGHLRLSAITRTHLQDIVDRMVAGGKAPSTVRNTLVPLRAIYRRALAREHVHNNPTLKLDLPAVRARRDRIARPHEAAALIAALSPEHQALWATALYAGLRAGELRALHWHDIDLDQRLIHVNHSWDRVVGPVEPKSRSGKRRVPLTGTLRTILLQHRLRQGHAGQGLAFGKTPTEPFSIWTVAHHAKTAWHHAGLTPIGLHECRHTYAAYMIAAGINPKALSTYMGHASITITLDRYGHLLPGNEHQAATMLDTWLAAH